MSQSALLERLEELESLAASIRSELSRESPTAESASDWLPPIASDMGPSTAATAVKRRPARKSATPLTNQLLLAISARWPMQSLCWRQNVTLAHVPTKDGLRPVRSCPNGTADIMGCVKGCAIAIEVKVGRDKLSSAQVKWRDAWVKAGGVYVEAREFEGAMGELSRQVEEKSR